MAANRFEQVDEAPDDAITLSLANGEAGPAGTISCPAALAGGHLVNDFESDAMAPVDAFRQAIRLANEIQAPVVVIDANGLWQPEWGALYRDEDA